MQSIDKYPPPPTNVFRLNSRKSILFSSVLALIFAVFSLIACDDDAVNQTPVAGDYTAGNLSQTAGSVTSVIITAKSGKSPGAVNKIQYNGSATIPQTAGTYAVTFDVAEAAGWNEAVGLYAGYLAVIDKNANTAVTFNRVTANGSILQTTTQLTLNFSQAITDLSAADITLSGVSDVTKGTLSGSGPEYTLDISGFSAGGTLSVTVVKSGYTISGSLKTVTIYYYVYDGSPIISLGIEMELIPAGTFQMGSLSSEAGRWDDEGPRHSVTLKEFSMSKYQVTQEQYQAVMGINPSYFTTANDKAPADGESDKKRPVENVTWYDAVEFCNKLSVLAGRQEVYTISGRSPASGYPITNAAVTADFTKNGYRLPTEAEWEYACRAGTTTAYNTGGTISDNTGWYSSNSGNMTHEVGLKPANTWGLYDTHGNVFEWCWDWYDYYSNDPVSNPIGSESGDKRVQRGGSWFISGQFLRSAYRTSDDPGVRLMDTGFRVVCTY